MNASACSAACGRMAVPRVALPSAVPAAASITPQTRLTNRFHLARAVPSSRTLSVRTHAVSPSAPWSARDCRLVLADGTVFEGRAFGAEGTKVAEVVFNTSLSGYQEIMTDPSYKEQMVCFTYPHIGNTGINDGAPPARARTLSLVALTSTNALQQAFRKRSALRYPPLHHRVVVCA